MTGRLPPANRLGQWNGPNADLHREAWKLRARSRREIPVDPIDRVEPSVDDVGDAIGAEAERDAVRRAFLAQPERCRRLLAFVASVDRPDYDVIAEALGMKRGSIGPARGRCLDKLRKTLLADPAWNGGSEAETDDS